MAGCLFSLARRACKQRWLNQSRGKAAGRSLADITISPQVSIYITEIFRARDRERAAHCLLHCGMACFTTSDMHAFGLERRQTGVRQAYQTREREKAAQL